jgi:hypothetical protein
MKRILFFSALIPLLLSGCIDRLNSDRQVEGMRPVYSADEDWQAVYTLPARPIGTLGKIYYKDATIYVVEVGEGIHVLDNQNPSSPTTLHFWRILGCVDVAIKGNVLYADNFTDLITVDISNPTDIKLLNRVPDLYPAGSLDFPTNFRGRFECPDPSKGRIIRWEMALLDDPKCWL